jgi:hypothetical protein
VDSSFGDSKLTFSIGFLDAAIIITDNRVGQWFVGDSVGYGARYGLPESSGRKQAE